MTPLPPQLEGVKVFPVQPMGKLPATTTGWKEASDDPTQIERWLRINPDFNWAVACGPSGLFVVDVDPNGLDWWAKLLERDHVVREAVANAFQVRTPRGGLHIYFRGEGPSTASRIADGIDTRGGINKNGKIVSGGYVLLPGSKTRDGSYSALPGGSINDLPNCISQIIPARQKTDTLGLAKNPDKDLPRNVQTANDLIENYVKSGRVAIEGKGGDNLTFQVCASILDKAISPGMCFDLLWEKWNPHNSPPWDEHELEQKIINAAKHGEDTDSGAKGHQSNEDAFAHFVGMETPDLAHVTAERKSRVKLQFIQDYADSVGDPEWLIPSVLPRRGVVMLYGQSGSYKSFVALDLALTLAFGIEGQWGNPSREKQDILYLAGEAPVGMAKLRFPAWMHWKEQEFRTEHRMMIKNRVPSYTNIEEWENIKKDLDELNAKPAVIFIDTLSRLMMGMAENESKDGVTVMNFMEELSQYFDCVVVFVHHTVKDGKTYRGSSVYFDNADSVISLKKSDAGDGTFFQIHKHKDEDVEEGSCYLKVVPVLNSIVLEKAEMPNDGNKQKGNDRPRIAWAEPGAIVAMLTVDFPTGTTTAYLAQHIGEKYDVEPSKVSNILTRSGELNYLKDGNRWCLPTGDGGTSTAEFDL